MIQHSPYYFPHVKGWLHANLKKHIIDGNYGINYLDNSIYFLKVSESVSILGQHDRTQHDTTGQSTLNYPAHESAKRANTYSLFLGQTSFKCKAL